MGLGDDQPWAPDCRSLPTVEVLPYGEGAAHSQERVPGPGRSCHRMPFGQPGHRSFWPGAGELEQEPARHQTSSLNEWRSGPCPSNEPEDLVFKALEVRCQRHDFKWARGRGAASTSKTRVKENKGQGQALFQQHGKANGRGKRRKLGLVPPE